MKIPEYLINAYASYYGTDDQDLDRDSAIERIRADSPPKRLQVYCTWEGILGYYHRLFTIATTETYDA